MANESRLETQLKRKVFRAEKKLRKAQKKLNKADDAVQDGWDRAERWEDRSRNVAKDRQEEGLEYRESALLLWEMQLQQIERDNHYKADAQVELLKAQCELKQALDDLDEIRAMNWMQRNVREAAVEAKHAKTQLNRAGYLCGAALGDIWEGACS